MPSWKYCPAHYSKRSILVHTPVSPQLLRQMVDTVPALLGCFDAKGALVFVNAAYEEWFRQPRSEILGHTLEDLLGPRAGPLVKHLRRALAGHRVDFEETVVYPAGERVVRGHYIPTGEGSSGEAVIAFLVDASADVRNARRFQFLAEAGEILSSSVDYEVTIEAALLPAMPWLGDAAGVDILERDGSLRRLLSLGDRGLLQAIESLERRYPSDPDANIGTPRVVRIGQSELHRDISKQMLEAAARDSEHLRLLEGLALRSVMIVPMNVRGRTVGALWLARVGGAFAPYDNEDLALVERLAERMAAAVDHAQLYRASREGRDL